MRGGRYFAPANGPFANGAGSGCGQSRNVGPMITVVTL